MSELNMTTFQREISLDTSFSRRRKNKPKPSKTNGQQTHSKILPPVCGDDSSNEFIDVISTPTSPLEVFLNISDLIPNFEGIEIGTDSSVHKQSILKVNSNSAFRVTDSADSCESNKESCPKEIVGFSTVFSPNRTNKQDVKVPVRPDDIINLDLVFEKTLSVRCEKLDLEQFCSRNRYKKISSDTVLLKSVPIVEKSVAIKDDVENVVLKCNLKASSKKSSVKCEDNVSSNYTPPTIIRCNPVSSNSTCTTPIVIWPAGSRTNLRNDNFSNVNNQTINISNNCSFPGQSNHSVNISNDHRNIEYNPISSLNYLHNSNSLQTAAVTSSVNNELDAINSVDDTLLDALNFSSLDLTNIENDENLIEIIKDLNNLLNSSSDSQNINLFAEKNISSAENFGSSLVRVSSSHLNNDINVPSLNISQCNEPSQSSNLRCVNASTPSHSTSLTSNSKTVATEKFSKNSVPPATSTPVKITSNITVISTSDDKSHSKHNEVVESKDEEEVLNISEERRLEDIKKEMESFMLSAKPKTVPNVAPKPFKRKTIGSKTSSRWRLLNQKKSLPSYPLKSPVSSEFGCSQYNAELDGLLFSQHNDLFVDNFVTDYFVVDTPKNKIKASSADISSDNFHTDQNDSSTIADESSATSNNSQTTNNSLSVKDKPLKNHVKQNKSKTSEFVCSLVKDEKTNNKKSILKGSYRSPIRIKVSRNFALNLKKSKGEIKKHRRKKYASLRKPPKQSGGREKQTFSPDDTILSSKKKSSKQLVNVKHKHLKDKKSNSSAVLTDFNACTENESHEKENVTGNSFASRSSENDVQDDVEKFFEATDNKVQHHSYDSESSGSDKELATKLIRSKKKSTVSSHLSSTANIAQVRGNKMESIKKNGSLECENNVSIDSDLANISTKTTGETTNDETSQFQENSISSEKANSTLSSSSNDLCESELQSNEITSETLTVPRDTGDNEREAKPKNWGVTEVSASRVKGKGEEKSICEVESTSEQSEADDHVSSSELAKDFTNEDSADAIPESNVEDKSNLPPSESNLSEDMEVDLKVSDEERKLFKTTVESQELEDNILSDNAVDNTFDKTEISLEASIHKVNKSSLLDKDMDSTNDSHILERDLKLSDDSSDNLIIIDEESGSKEMSKEGVSLKMSEDKLKSFENVVGGLTESENKETEDNKTITSDSVNQETSLKGRTKSKLKKINDTDKSSIVSETHLGKGKSLKKDNIRLTINVIKDSVANDSDELSSQNMEKSTSNSSLRFNISVKRRTSRDEVQSETDKAPGTSEVKPNPVEDEISNSITPVESDGIVSKKSNKKQATKKSNKVKKKESEEDTSLHETSDDTKAVNAAEQLDDKVSLKSLLVNTPKSSNEESPSPMLSLIDSSSQENGRLPLSRPPRNKVKKRPYSPDTTPTSSLVNKTPSNKSSSSSKSSTPTSSKLSSPTASKLPSPTVGKLSTPVSQASSPSSAQRKKLKKYNADDVVVPFKCGWMRELVHRATTGGKARASDVYYFTPEGNKLRSMPEIAKYLAEHQGHGLTSDNFTFAKETVYRSPFERERDANVKSTIGNKSSSEVLSSGKKKPVKKSVEQSFITDSSPSSSVTVESTPISEKAVEKKTAKSEVASTEKSAKSSEKRPTKQEPSLEKRKAEPESNAAGPRKARVRSTDSSTLDTSKDNADKTEHRSKSAKLSNDSGSKPKKSEKTPIIKVKFTKNFGKAKTTPTVNIRGIGCDIEDDLQQILTTSVEKSTSKDANKKSVKTKPSQQKRKRL